MQFSPVSRGALIFPEMPAIARPAGGPESIRKSGFGCPILAVFARVWFLTFPFSSSSASYCTGLVHSGAKRCIIKIMKSQNRSVRQSVSLPPSIATRVRHLAEKRKASASRVLVDLIEAGLRSKEAEKEYFFSLTNQLVESAHPAERRRLKKELARLTFGD